MDEKKRAAWDKRVGPEDDDEAERLLYSIDAEGVIHDKHGNVIGKVLPLDGPGVSGNETLVGREEPQVIDVPAGEPQ